MYTYGQMRVGNAVYAALANQLMGEGIYRGIRVCYSLTVTEV